MNYVVVFDADNTIWDTDAVFRNAQLSLLRTLANFNIVSFPDSQLETLRKIDRELINREDKFEYDFKLLPAAIIEFFTQSKTITDAVLKVTSSNWEELNPKFLAAVDEANNAFANGLSQIPDLYPDTDIILNKLNEIRRLESTIAVLLFSEGDQTRIKHILQVHQIESRKFFDEIIIGTKSRQAFEEAKNIGMSYLSARSNINMTHFFLIGDSLKRDIMYGNQAGFITIYKPSDFQGYEIASSKDEQPKYVISRLRELIPVLERYGITF